MKTKLAPPTEEAQLKAKEEAIAWAKSRLADKNTLIVDVETTGLLTKDPKTEIVSISILNTDGKVVFASLVNPGRPIPMEAQKVHGIDNLMVADAPPWSIVGNFIAAVIEGKHLVAYNAGFDVHLMVTLFQRYNIDIGDFDVSCAMENYSQFVGDWSRAKGDWKWQKLPKLAFGKAHDSFVDTMSTLLLMRKMAGDLSDEPKTDDINLDF